MMTEYSVAVVVAWSLFVLFVGYLLGSWRAKQPADDRARLDRPPPSPSLQPKPAEPTGPSELSPDARTLIEEALRYGRKIEAIKIMREQTGMSLAQAKDAVEEMER